MQKWEYLELSWYHEKGVLRYALNGEFKLEWDGTALHTVLNNLGKEGWEMVSMEYGQREAFFKKASS